MIIQVLASTIFEEGNLFKVIAAHSVEEVGKGIQFSVTCHSTGLQYDIV
jgi:hypothetical protein